MIPAAPGAARSSDESTAKVSSSRLRPPAAATPVFKLHPETAREPLANALQLLCIPDFTSDHRAAVSRLVRQALQLLEESK